MAVLLAGPGGLAAQTTDVLPQHAEPGEYAIAGLANVVVFSVIGAIRAHRRGEESVIELNQEEDNPMNPRTWIPVALFAVLPAVACQELVEPLADPPAFEGTVTQVALESNGGEIFVELTKAPLDVERATFRLKGWSGADAAAVFVRGDNASAQEASFSDLTVGDQVEIWIEDGMARSDPPIYAATQIVIIRD